MSKDFNKAKINETNLNPTKHDYYKSGRLDVNHIEEDEEIKASVPIQVRINGGEWVDVRALDPQN